MWNRNFKESNQANDKSSDDRWATRGLVFIRAVLIVSAVILIAIVIAQRYLSIGGANMTEPTGFEENGASQRAVIPTR